MDLQMQSKNDLPLISIIIPVYNRKELVMQAIKSALNQTYPNKEVVVVDDGSTDGTYEKLEELKDPIFLYRQNHNGDYPARNLGWRACHGDYVIFLDSDDVLEDFAISALWSALSQAEKVDPVWGISYGKTLRYDADLNEIKTKPRKYYSGDILPWLLSGGSISTGSWLVRKSVLEEIGGFKEDAGSHWDRVLLCFIACRYKFVVVNKIVGRIRYHEHRKTSDRKTKVKQGTLYLDYFFQKAKPLPNKVLQAKDKIYARRHLKLIKTAWREHLHKEYLYHWKQACFYHKLFFLHPKYLTKAIASFYLR